MEWNEAGPRHPSRRRLGQSGPLSGFNYFMKVNAARLKQGLPLLERPLQWGGRRTPKAKAGQAAQGQAQEGKGFGDGWINGLMGGRREGVQVGLGLAPGVEGCRGGWCGQGPEGAVHRSKRRKRRAKERQQGQHSDRARSS